MAAPAGRLARDRSKGGAGPFLGSPWPPIALGAFFCGPRAQAYAPWPPSQPAPAPAALSLFPAREATPGRGAFAGGGCAYERQGARQSGQGRREKRARWPAVLHREGGRGVLSFVSYFVEPLWRRAGSGRRRHAGGASSWQPPSSRPGAGPAAWGRAAFLRLCM
ncbi:unnamed protein product [Amoebophrya sp. A120]|nr:unnamed protein product [Amoebophrya sp. A120]|eukprot:GSA120T00008492001.1